MLTADDRRMNGMAFLSTANNRRRADWQLYALDQFHRFMRVWDEINERGPASPLLSTDFVLPLIDCFAHATDLIAICRSEDRPIAMAILGPVGTGRWSTRQPVAAPLGLWVATKETDIATILPALLKTLPGFAFMLSVMNQDNRLVCKPPNVGSIGTVGYMKTPATIIDTSFSDYWTGRSQNLKHNLRKSRSRLAREGKTPSLEIVVAPGSIDSAFDEYCIMENAGWKGKNGSSIELHPAMKRFYRKVMANFAQHGNTQIYRYCYDDRLVATDLCIKSHQTLIVLKITYEESEGASSPSSLMREEETRYAVDQQKINRIEFYGPLMDWHQRWATEVRTMYHVNCYRFSFLRVLHEYRVNMRQAPENSAKGVDVTRGA